MRLDRERDGSVYHLAPMCRCGSRNQKKLGTLRWFCLECNEVRSYRVCNGEFLGFPDETALAIDAMRAGAL